jgi:hypothetical protein
MKEMVAIVPNHRPAYVAEPISGDNNEVTEIRLNPVVAWKVVYTESSEEDSSFASPITAESLPSTYAIYYSDTESWIIPEDRMGDGLVELLEEFNLRASR